MGLQTRFIKFHEAIKLKRYDENRTLIEKRDAVLDKVRDGLARQFKGTGKAVPTFTPINLGSYEMGTGVKPLDSDYDIDVGLVFNLKTSDHEPLTVKGWVFNAVDGHTKRVEWREPVVTVFYQRQGESVYHVDLAIYAPDFWGTKHLARGKQHSGADQRKWEPADPEGLITAVKTRFDGEDGKQFRRVIRYLKRWRDENFPSEGNAAPVGIGLTVAAYHWFSPYRTGVFTVEHDDFEALRRFVATLRERFTVVQRNGRTYRRLAVMLPVTPRTDIFAKMSDEQMTQFYGRLETLSTTLADAAKVAARDEREAARIIARALGRDFPTD